MDDSFYCECCDDAFSQCDWMPVTRGYEQREVCPNCGAASLPFLSEDGQMLGDYLLSVCDEGWTCGCKGAMKDLFVRYEA